MCDKLSGSDSGGDKPIAEVRRERNIKVIRKSPSRSPTYLEHLKREKDRLQAESEKMQAKLMDILVDLDIKTFNRVVKRMKVSHTRDKELRRARRRWKNKFYARAKRRRDVESPPASDGLGVPCGHLGADGGL
tara:strand:+ start:573 stop:971 length:399 start_codon:yes stop_codon:yes gene_type:complete